MSLKNVVQVMNFHSLLRVDRSRKIAKKYSQMESMVLDMLDNILNNRNIVLDVHALKTNPNAPELHIFMGSDLGFCGNLNNLVRRSWSEESGEKEFKTIIIGRKLKHLADESTVLFMSREEFQENHDELLRILSEGIRKKQYSAYRLIYNHYWNASEVEFVDKVVFPMPKGMLGKKEYTEDFVCEDDLQEMVLELTDLYLQYEVEIASHVSMAAENITRQNITTESLKRIDEREEEIQQAERREQKDKEFAKVLDNYTKLKNY